MTPSDWSRRCDDVAAAARDELARRRFLAALAARLPHVWRPAILLGTGDIVRMPWDHDKAWREVEAVDRSQDPDVVVHADGIDLHCDASLMVEVAGR